MRKSIIMLVFLLITFHSRLLFAHDDKIIHTNITEKAVSNPDINLDKYLINNLNIIKGLETKLPSNNGQSIMEWLKKGSTDEDDLNVCRASNHFHDPMNDKSWSTSGMSDEPLWADAVCFFWKPFYSDVTWATGFTSPTATPIPYNPENEKSPNMWANARTLYYNALTATTQTTRENNFAQMFTSIGQVMHLLQEVAS